MTTHDVTYRTLFICLSRCQRDATHRTAPYHIEHLHHGVSLACTSGFCSCPLLVCVTLLLIHVVYTFYTKIQHAKAWRGE